MENMDDEEEAPKGYINANVKLDKVKKHMRAVLVNLFLLWLSAQACPAVLITHPLAERCFLSRASSFCGPKSHWLDFCEDAHSIMRRWIQRQEFKAGRSRRHQKINSLKFMVAVLLGIYCSVTTARLVEEHLDKVLAAQTLKQAVEVVAKHARQARDCIRGGWQRSNIKR